MIHNVTNEPLELSNEFMFISDNTIYQRTGWRDTEHPPDSKLITKLKAIGKNCIFQISKKNIPNLYPEQNI